MANTPNPIKSQVTLYIVGGIVVIAVASIVYLAIARPILQKIGIIDDKKDKERDKTQKKSQSQLVVAEVDLLRRKKETLACLLVSQQLRQFKHLKQL